MNFFRGCLQPITRHVESSDTNVRQKGFLWYKDLGQQFGGEFSMAVVQANNQVEDENQVASGCLSDDVDGPYGTFVGIYDGHGGPDAARYISEHLINNLKTAAAQSRTISAEVIQRAIQVTEEGFFSIVSERWVNTPQLASVGSCCLVGVICGGLLYIANLGDSRAVLGRHVRSTGEVLAVQLSSEHNANIESIRQEMHSRHPEDPQIVSYRNNSWRVKGIIQVTRAIGDVYLKNPDFNRAPLLPKFRLREPFEDPILSAEPAFCVTQLQPQDKFIIFASDGLWDQLSNQDAVDIVRTYPRSGSARKLVKAAMTKAAKKIGSTYKKIKEAPVATRRENHDDISVTVIFLDMPLLSRASTEKTPTISVRSGRT